MSKTIEAVVIEPGGELRLEQLQRGAQPLQSLVGGWIEAAPCDDSDLTFFINEEGKLINLEPNPLGTALWYRTTPMMVGHDHLVGTVVITGGVDENGDTLGLPPNWQEKFAGLVAFDEDGIPV